MAALLRDRRSLLPNGGWRAPARPRWTSWLRTDDPTTPVHPWRPHVPFTRRFRTGAPRIRAATVRIRSAYPFLQPQGVPAAAHPEHRPAVGQSNAVQKPAARDAVPPAGPPPPHAEDPRPPDGGLLRLGKGGLRACRILPWRPCRCCHPGTRRCRRRLPSGHRLRRTLRGRTGRRSRCPCRCGAG